MTIAIHWFRRDLRLHDNPALLAAVHAGTTALIPLFILDDTILAAARTGAARTAFMLDSLRALDVALRAHGSRLIIRRGPTLEVLRALVDETRATLVTWNRDYTPFATRRDTAVADMLAARGVAMQQCKDAVLFERDEILSGSQKPYTVYTPYAKVWRARVAALGPVLDARPLPALAAPPADLADEGIPEPAALGITLTQQIPLGGEREGLARLESFARARITAYDEARNFPAVPGTSRLSAYLRFGCVAPLACLRAALAAADAATTPAARTGADTWIGELAWRDFYYQILVNFPHVLRGAFRPQYDAVQWEHHDEYFAAWQAGRTGYPIVDAAMRQLEREAWMHNRSRMIVASFLTKDLLIDWRRGELHFMRRLVDGDHASNNGGWQWAAGTGTDAQPFFRIFNPISQGEKFDPQGEYVRRYLPELQRVPAKYIHAPWTMPAAEQARCGVIIGRDYPAPIVDHATQRNRALALYRAARG